MKLKKYYVHNIAKFNKLIFIADIITVFIMLHNFAIYDFIQYIVYFCQNFATIIHIILDTATI